MRKNNFILTKKSVYLVLFISVLSFQTLNAQVFCTDSNSGQYSGVKDGYRYELWNQNSQGDACMTLGKGALFSGKWGGILNYLARRGLEYDQTKKHQEIGQFYADYNCHYAPIDTSGNSYLSIYGWTLNPLAEYYIVEDWRNWIPSMDPNATLKGTLEIDGSIYDIYENTRVNQPSIVGNTTFQQYFSIRRDRRNSGKINISEHFKKWEAIGLEMGALYEVSFVVEGYQSSGSFEFTSLDVFVDNKKE